MAEKRNHLKMTDYNLDGGCSPVKHGALQASPVSDEDAPLQTRETTYVCLCRDTSDGKRQVMASVPQSCPKAFLELAGRMLTEHRRREGQKAGSSPIPPDLAAQLSVIHSSCERDLADWMRIMSRSLGLCGERPSGAFALVLQAVELLSAAGGEQLLTAFGVRDDLPDAGHLIPDLEIQPATQGSQGGVMLPEESMPQTAPPPRAHRMLIALLRSESRLRRGLLNG